MNDASGAISGPRGLFAACESVGRGEFHDFVRSLNATRSFPGAIGVGYIQCVPRSELEEFVAAAREDGAPDFTVSAPGQDGAEADPMYILKYIEPEEISRRVIGKDLGSEGSRREAIERAIRTGAPASSTRVTLILDDPQVRYGFLYVLPVYRGGETPATEEERVASVEGLICAPVTLDATREHVRSLTGGYVDLEVFDSDVPDARTVLFHTDTDALTPDSPDVNHRFDRVYSIHVPGRTWTAVVHSTPAFDASVNSWIAPVMGVVGSVVAILISVSFWLIGSARSRATAIAKTMTVELQAACDRAERNLQDVLAFRVAIDSSAIVSEADSSGRILDVNEAFCCISGYSRGELLGQNHRILNSGVHSAQFWGDVWSHVANGRPWRGEICNRTKQGALVWLDSIIAPFTDAQGRVERYVSIRFDVTARKAAEQRLAESEQLFRTLADSAPMLVWTSDSQSRCNYVNTPWLQFTGHDFAKFVSDGWLEPIHADDRGRVRELYERSFAARASFETEFRFLHRHRGYRTLLCRGTPLIASGGEFVGYVGACIDITQLREAQVRAESASQAKTAFLANMSHEIRTPLTAILGYVELLHEDGSGPSPDQDRSGAVDSIRAAGRHLMAVLNDILELSKVETGRLQLEHVDTPVLSIVRDVVEILRPTAAGKGVQLEIELASEVPDRIRADPTRLRQVVMNIVGNAVKFTEAGSVTILVHTLLSESGCDRFTIDVVDTGPGIALELVPQLFGAFTQADESLTRRHGGTGFGLALAKRLATLMRGDVTLFETRPGHGSTFRIELPLDIPETAVMTRVVPLPDRAPSQLPKHSQEMAPEPAAVLASPQALSGRILLAEDGPDNQRLIAFHLRKAGATVSIAENGRVALDEIRRAREVGVPFDLLLTDMQMPEMDGYSLASTLRSQGNAMPIVALTAHAMPEDRARCIAAGCDDYASKPIDKAMLIATCARWLTNAGDDSRRAA